MITPLGLLGSDQVALMEVGDIAVSWGAATPFGEDEKVCALAGPLSMLPFLRKNTKTSK